MIQRHQRPYHVDGALSRKRNLHLVPRLQRLAEEDRLGLQNPLLERDALLRGFLDQSTLDGTRNPGITHLAQPVNPRQTLSERPQQPHALHLVLP